MADVAISYPMAGLVAVNVPLGTSDRIRFDRFGDTKEMPIAPATERLGVLGAK